MCSASEIEYRILTEVNAADRAAMAELYRAVGWIEPQDAGEFIPAAVVNSAVTAAAYAGGKLVGMGRALSDNVSDAYIQDVAVSPEFRKRGIGGELVKLLIAELKRRGVDWIGLVGEPGTENFYRELGFEPQQGFTCWKLK